MIRRVRNWAAELDLTGVRAHVRQSHPQITPVPRATVDVARAHARWHHRYQSGHYHVTGVIDVGERIKMRRVEGWYTGAGAVARDPLASGSGVVRDAGGTILRGPSLPCGCPLDADCTGYHPGALS